MEWEALPDEKWFQHHVDCHPLIREYFGFQLRTRYKVAFRAAHGRLYDHFRFAGLPEEFRDAVAYALLAYKSSYPEGPLEQRLNQLIRKQITLKDVPNLPPAFFRATEDELRSAFRILQSAFRIPAGFLPTTEAAMTPLFAAIGHGCLAGRQDECFKEVYLPRIARGNEKYATNQLGLYGQDLAAVASFFEKPFQLPSSGLQPSHQALVLNLAGFALRAIGCLPDAVEPFRAAVKAHVVEANWKGASANSGNLSEVLLTLGQVERDEEGQPGARPVAEQAVAYADQSGDLGSRLVAQSQLGDAAFRAGQLRSAEESFKEAERLEGSRMYSLRGFLYGELLLARGRAVEVADRAEYLISVRMDSDSILDRALEELNQARAQARLTSQPSTKNQEPRTPSPFLNALLDANNEDDIPRGYLAEAEISLEAGDGRPQDSSSLQLIASSLTEAETRARRGPMPLFLAEVWLLRSRLAVGSRQLTEARTYRDEARELIEKHGYGRRKPDLAVLTCEIDPGLVVFRTACRIVGAEGWWELLPRLEALVAARPAGGWFKKGDRSQWDQLLAPLREAEQEYQRERDGYLREQLAVGSRQPEPGADADGLLAQLPQEVIQRIVAQTGAPADWRQWTPEFKAAVVQAIVKSQSQGPAMT